MEAQVAGQLGMKAQGDDTSLADRDRVSVVLRDHLRRARRFDQRSPDEDARKWLPIQTDNVQRGFEAVDLAAVAITPDPDVEQPEPVLIGHSVYHVAREH